MLAIEKLFNELHMQLVKIEQESDLAKKLQLLGRLKKIVVAIEAVENIDYLDNVITGLVGKEYI